MKKVQATRRMLGGDRGAAVGNYLYWRLQADGQGYERELAHIIGLIGCYAIWRSGFDKWYDMAVKQYGIDIGAVEQQMLGTADLAKINLHGGTQR